MEQWSNEQVGEVEPVRGANRMVVTRLYVKPGRARPLDEVRQVAGIAGTGLAFDCHAALASPRQVLLVGEPAIRALRLRGDDLQGNIVLSRGIERLPSGTVLRLGGLEVRLTILCEPCAKLDKVRPGLGRESIGRRGYLGRVMNSGVASVGDEVTIVPPGLRPLDPGWKPRVADIVAHIPRGSTLRITALAKMAGVDPIYCRAMPGVLRVLGLHSDLPIHRVIPSDPARIAVADGELLRREGVDLAEPASWDGVSYFEPEEQAHGTSVQAAGGLAEGA